MATSQTTNAERRIFMGKMETTQKLHGNYYRNYRFFPVTVAFVFGMVLGKMFPWMDGSENHQGSGMELVRAQHEAIVFLDEIPFQPTSHQGVNKKQLVNPFSVHPNLAGVSVGILKPKQTISLHEHESMSEFFFVVEGQGYVQLEEEEKQLIQQGSFIYVHPKKRHSFSVPESEKQPMKIVFFGLIDD